jgi:hypothetical protein
MRQSESSPALCARGSLIDVTVQAAALETLVPHPQNLAGRAVIRDRRSDLDGYLRSLTSLEETPAEHDKRYVE